MDPPAQTTPVRAPPPEAERLPGFAADVKTSLMLKAKQKFSGCL